MKKHLTSFLLSQKLRCNRLFVKAEVFDTIDSTNLEARRLFTRGVRVPTLVLSSTQTAGRGRLGRQFYSPNGSGLYFSLLYPVENVADFVPLTAAVSVAVRKAIERLCGISLDLKWVNDLLKGGKKVGGILCESVQDETTSALIIGIGLNLRPMQFPQELFDIAGSLQDSQVSISALASEILTELLPFLQNPYGRGWLEDYKQHSVLLGKKILCIRGAETFAATALDIDENAGLLIRLSDGSVLTLSSGEVTVRLDI